MSALHLKGALLSHKMPAEDSFVLFASSIVKKQFIFDYYYVGN